MIIGCKMPNGISFNYRGKYFTFNGANTSSIIDGFGLTRDVPSDVWSEFMRSYSKSDFVVNGLVFAVTDNKSAKSAANERAEIKTGFEKSKKPKNVQVTTEG